MSISALSFTTMMDWDSGLYPKKAAAPCKDCTAAHLYWLQRSLYMHIPCMLVFMGYLVVGFSFRMDWGTGALSYLRVHAVDRFVISFSFLIIMVMRKHYWHNGIAWLLSCRKFPSGTEQMKFSEWSVKFDGAVLNSRISPYLPLHLEWRFLQDIVKQLHFVIYIYASCCCYFYRRSCSCGTTDGPAEKATSRETAQQEIHGSGMGTAQVGGVRE